MNAEVSEEHHTEPGVETGREDFSGTLVHRCMLPAALQVLLCNIPFETIMHSQKTDPELGCVEQHMR